jgi:hypothetical protein
MKITKRSNCLFGALAIRRQLGGELDWRPGWQRDGWAGFLGNPWGHFRVRLPGGKLLSYSALDKDMPVWHQLWFSGRIRRRSE